MDKTQILIAILGTVSCITTGVIGFSMWFLNRKVKKVHVVVNSERSAMIDELKKLHAVILELSKDKARKEGQHGKP